MLLQAAGLFPAAFLCFIFSFRFVDSPRHRYACRPSLFRKEGKKVFFIFSPPLSVIGGERGLGGVN
jgi:hypothetical protein